MPDGTCDIIGSDLQEVLTGLNQAQKTLPAKLFYDAEGCRLFDEITRLPEYYPTRTEKALLARVVPTLDRLSGCAVVEFGGSDEEKALILLDHLGASDYVPIDIAQTALDALTHRLRDSRPGLAVHPVAGDFMQRLVLPRAVIGKPVFGFFPGSTIGNLDPAAAHRFLLHAREMLAEGATFLIGVDLRKDPAILIPAYNDAQGVTAAFNRNILLHVNARFDGDFDPNGFAHQALWNAALGRVEMHLVSQREQSVSIADQTVSFTAGETIHTENSYKHSLAGFAAMAAEAGWRPAAAWTDDAELFSIHLLTALGSDA